MRAHRVVLLAALLAAGGVAAATARGDELYAVVDRTAAPGERALVKVSADAPGPVRVLAYRVEDPGVLLRAGLDLRRGGPWAERLDAALRAARPSGEGAEGDRGGDASAARDVPALDPGLTFVARAVATLSAPPGPRATPRPEGEATPLAGATVEVPLPASGLYVLEVLDARSRAVVFALVSRLALVTKRDPSGVLAFATDRTSGRAIEDVAVEVWAADRLLAQGRTAGDGLVRLAADLPPSVQIRAAKDDDLAYGADLYAPSEAADRRVHVFTHQPAYRPGERVEAKGIVRTPRDGGWALDPEVREAVVAFLAAGDRVVGESTVPVSADLGTFAASCELPEATPTGEGRIVVRLGERTYEAPWRVEAYRKPTFQVAVSPSAPRAAPGEELSFVVEAEFYEGGSPAGAPVAWTLLYHRVDRELLPTDELARLFFGTEREAFAPRTVAQGHAVLDAAGRATVVARAPALEQDGYLTLRAAVTGPDRTVVTGGGVTAYASVPLSVAMTTDRRVYGAEGVARATIRAVLADGAPAAARTGVLAVARVGEAVTPQGRVPEERPVGSFPFTTDGQGLARVEVPFAQEGRFALTAILPRRPPEPDGAPARATLLVWVAGDRADVGFAGDRLEVVADRDVYAVGDTARLLVLSPVGGRPFLATTEAARLLTAGTRPLGGADDRGVAAVLEVVVGPEHVPNAWVGAALVDQGRLLATTAMLRVPPVDRVLHPDVRAAREVLEPGETTALTTTVRDAAGVPVAGAEVALAVVDEALHALFADPAAPLVPFFHGVRRNDVRTGGPLDAPCVGWGVRRVEREKLAERERAIGSGGGHGGQYRGPGGSVPPGLRPGFTAGAPAPEAPGADTDQEGSRDGKAKADEGAEGPLAAREDFRSAVWWSPALRTGADGRVESGPVRFPDALTRWRVTATAVDASTRVGRGVTSVRTAKRVVVRLTPPRFLRVGDDVVVPMTLHSLLDGPAQGRWRVGGEGVRLEGAAQGVDDLPAGALVTREVHVRAEAVGAARLEAELRTDREGDAVAASFPVQPQGVPQVVASSATTQGPPVDLPPLVRPASARPGSARLRILAAPSVAQAVAAALPYLLDYPYGCTEQTMSRLLPAVVAKTARDRFQVAPTGRLAEVEPMIERGLARLGQLRHEDGGFGWWERDASDAWMTAYVLHGLTRVADAGGALVAPDLAAGASRWLLRWLGAGGGRGPADAADGAALRAFVAMALADAKALPEGALPAARREGSTALAQAFLLRASLASGQRLAEVPARVEALEALATRDATGVRWGDETAPSRWSEDPVETTAWALGALAAARPEHPDLVPGQRWLLAQRRGGDHWRSTRDTAAAVACLTRLALATGDLGVGRRVHLELNGVRLEPLAVTPENAWGPVEVLLDEGRIPPGPLLLRASTEGGLATVTMALGFEATGPAIERAEAGFEVTRAWWLLEPADVDGRAGLVRRAVTETVPSGALLDVEVTVTTDRPREHVLVTSPHVAGFEPERDLGATYVGSPPPPAATADHVERLDDRTAFFVARLAAGTHVFRHRVRAVHVGSFTALPAQAELMYFPEVRGQCAGEAFAVHAAGPAASPAGGR